MTVNEILTKLEVVKNLGFGDTKVYEIESRDGFDHINDLNDIVFKIHKTAKDDKLTIHIS